MTPKLATPTMAWLPALHGPMFLKTGFAPCAE